MSDEHVHISRGITKLGAAIPSVNLPPGDTCRPDAPCFRLCYARKGRFSFTHTRDLLSRNLRLWRTDPDRYEREIECAAYTSRFFRFHSSGDIPDDAYLAMMIRVANRCKETAFLCFTKKFELVDKYIFDHGPEAIPHNLHIVYSAWGNFLPVNPHNLPIAYIKLRKEQSAIPGDARPCSGYCGDCVASGHSCWDLKPGQSVCFNQH